MRWYVGAILLLAAALVLQSGLLAYAMYVLLGVLVTSRFLTRVWIRHLSAERQCAALSADVGDRVAVEVTIRNHGWLPVPWVLLEDLIARELLRQPAHLRVKGKRLQLRMLAGGASITIRYKVECLRRGYYQLGPLVIETGDLFGLHRRYRVAAVPHFLLVYPRVVPLEGYELASRRPIGEVQLTHRLFEDPTRIAGVRPYQSGDPLTRIHWRATARTGVLHSKVYEASTLTGATIVLDFHQAGFHRQGEPFRSDLAVTAAVSLAHAVSELGQQIGLVTNGRDAAERIRREGWTGDYRTRDEARQSAGPDSTNDRLKPLLVETRRGVEQLPRIRELLARLERTDGLSFAELVIEAAAHLPRDATVVAILPDVTAETAITLGNLRRAGYAVAAIVIMLDPDQLEQAYARLLAEGILEMRHLQDELELPVMCQRQVDRAVPYHYAPTQ